MAIPQGTLNAGWVGQDAGILTKNPKNNRIRGGST
jgi:hypothetical protein